MTLIQAWVSSLSLLKPKNAQLFFLVTVKSIIECYKVILRYWWWLVMVLVVCVTSVILQDNMKASGLEILVMWLYQLMIFVVCISTRSSLSQKDCEYFIKYAVFFGYSAMCLLLLPYIFWPTPLSPFYFFILFFFLDSAKGWKDFLFSIGRAFRMIIYNYPLMIVIGLILYTPVYCVQVFMGLTPVIQTLVGVFLMPISICTYANVYIKKLHDQCELYITQP